MDTAAEQRLPRLFSFGQRHPWLVDSAIVTGLLLLALVPEHPGGNEALFSILLIVPLLWRRAHPGKVFAFIATVAAVQWATDARAFGDAALLVALYTVAATQAPRQTLLAAGVLEAGIIAAVARWASQDAILPALVGLTGLATAAGVLGSNARHRRALMASLRERASRLERERDQQGHLAAAAERARIAREMHDIVAHNLSVMIALADGASYAVRDTPERAEAAMRNASRTGREALAEMRLLLGVLREGPAERELAPQPGIAELEHVVDQVRAAGIPVDYRSEGEPGGLPQGLQLAAYRIVQEALTNTLKHGGPGTRARVRLIHADGHLEIDVRDEGGAASRPAEDGGGLRGMRERAAVYDGVVDAGPVPGGGWHVTTTLDVAARPAVGAGA